MTITGQENTDKIHKAVTHQCNEFKKVCQELREKEERPKPVAPAQKQTQGDFVQRGADLEDMYRNSHSKDSELEKAKTFLGKPNTKGKKINQKNSDFSF
jgi:hypothetical protein